jgi:acetamidase/formamidase
MFIQGHKMAIDDIVKKAIVAGALIALTGAVAYGVGTGIERAKYNSPETKIYRTMGPGMMFRAIPGLRIPGSELNEAYRVPGCRRY